MANSIQQLKIGAESRSVMIVDDDPEIAESLSRLLKVFFAECHIATDGEEAFALYRSRLHDPFTLVITDLELPKMGGLRLIREIRSLSPFQPVLILSAHDEARLMAEAISLEVQGYLLKPLAMPKLFESLEKIFALENSKDPSFNAQNDPVTGWKTYSELNKKLDSQSTPVTLLQLRVNDFNNILSFVGEDYANEYLAELAALLESLVERGEREFYRSSSDEFSLVLEGEQTEFAMQLANNMVSIVRYFHTSERGIILNSTLSIGIASGDRHVQRYAKQALDRINERHGGVSLYRSGDDVQSDPLSNNHDILRMIFNALVQEDIVPLFQPIVNAQTLEVEMHQSLIRIRKDGRLYGPDTFLQLAITMGQMVMITRSMIRNTLQQYSRLSGSAVVVINLSSNDLIDEGLLPYLRFWRERFSLSPSSVAFQLIDGIETLYDETSASTVRQLQNEGHKIILNHFGVGEFDLPLLLSLKPDYMNLHPKVTERLENDPEIGTIISKMVDIIHLIGSKAIAKNISNPGHIRPLREANIDYIQGFAVGDPFEVPHA